MLKPVVLILWEDVLDVDGVGEPSSSLGVFRFKVIRRSDETVLRGSFFARSRCSLQL